MFADQQPLDEGRADSWLPAWQRPAGRWRPTIRSSRCRRRSRSRSSAALDAYRVARDQLAEQMFFGFYGSPFVQALLGINKDSEVRPFPGTSPEKLAARQAAGGRVRGEAADRRVRRSADPGGAVRHRGRADDRPAFRTRVECRAPEAHASIARRVQGAGARPGLSCCSSSGNARWKRLHPWYRRRDARKELLKQVHAIVSAGDPPLAAERDRLARAVAGAGGADWEDGSSCNVRPALRRDYRAALRGLALIGMNSFTRTC